MVPPATPELDEGVPCPRAAHCAVPACLKGLFFIVGPTASGKSEIAADIASALNAEVVGADAFQIYRGLDLLTAKPDPATLGKAPHHLIGAIPLQEEINAEKFRRTALRAIEQIHSRGKVAIVVGGSGLYVKALTHGLDSVPQVDPALRARLNEWSLDRLREKIIELDPKGAAGMDMKNRRRLTRAIEICMLTGRPASAQRTQWPVDADLRAARRVRDTEAEGRVSHSETATAESTGQKQAPPTGVFVFRDRDELYARINRRVEVMFEKGVMGQVRTAGAVSETASKMIGWREIRDLLEGKKPVAQCIAEVQQATRRYAKRQLTWFRRQTNFKPLNLSLLTHNEAVKSISQAARMAGVALKG
jgi:tRNA dimethylallyltransferase